MKASAYYALGIGPTVALLVGCGGSSLPRAAGDASSVSRLLEQHQTFDYTGAEQTFIVPAGVTRLAVIARGAQGGGAITISGAGLPGFPGRVYAVIRVHAGKKLYVFVGGCGCDGGFNGGGSGGNSVTSSGSSSAAPRGGGASDVRAGGDTLKDRIIVAAGGGGSGAALYAADGGNGGGLTGHAGGGFGTGSRGGGGGTQTKGGAGGAAGSGSGKYGGKGHQGGLGRGGNGGDGASGCYGGCGGGGGGGGYYGGGGGGGGYHGGGGGGGGSSYVETAAITSQMWTGWRERGDGRIIFSWEER